MATVIRKFKIGLSKEDIENIKKELGKVETDLELNEDSINPISNKAVTQAINGLNAAQNLLDIVGTYADLQAYSQEFLQVNDKIKVLNDENFEDQASYYRWNGTQWVFIALEPVPKIEMDETPTEGSENFVSSGAVYDFVYKAISEEINEALNADYEIER